MENYEVLERIGEGSFGRVYRARKRGTTATVALKVIVKRGKSRKDLRALRQEISILKSLSHPNIIQLHDAFEERKHFVVVMEYAQGDLFAVLEDDRSMPLEELQKLAGQLVSALQYLHSNRIIHRDMKPQNILLSADGTVKLCDFGFARSMSAATNMVTSVKGTPLYMAPEVVQQHPYDFRADLWSLGVILFELFTGEPPFYTESIYKLVDLILKQPVPWPASMPRHLRSFLGGLLQKNARDRLAWPQLARHPFVLPCLPSTQDGAPDWTGERAFAGAHLVWFGDAQDPATPSKQPLAPVPMRVASFAAVEWAALQERVKTLGTSLDTPASTAHAYASAQSKQETPTTGLITDSPGSGSGRAPSPRSAAASAATASGASGESSPEATAPGATATALIERPPDVAAASKAPTAAEPQGAALQPEPEGTWSAADEEHHHTQPALDSVDSVDSAVGRLFLRESSPGRSTQPASAAAAAGAGASQRHSSGEAESLGDAESAEASFWKHLAQGNFTDAPGYISSLQPAANGEVCDWDAVWSKVAAVVEEPINTASGAARAEECLRCLAAALQWHTPEDGGSCFAPSTADAVDDIQLLLGEAVSSLGLQRTPPADAVPQITPELLNRLIITAFTAVGHILLLVWNHTSAQCARLGLQSRSPHAARVRQAAERLAQAIPEQITSLVGDSTHQCEAADHMRQVSLGLLFAASRLETADYEALQEASLQVGPCDETRVVEWLFQRRTDSGAVFDAACVVAACDLLQHFNVATLGNALVVSVMYSGLEQQTVPPATPQAAPGLLQVAVAIAGQSSRSEVTIARSDSPEVSRQADLCAFWGSGRCPQRIQDTQQASQLAHALAYKLLKTPGSSTAKLATQVAHVLQMRPCGTELAKLFIDACTPVTADVSEALFSTAGAAYFLLILERRDPSAHGAVFKLLAKSLASGALPADWFTPQHGGHAVIEKVVCILTDRVASATSSRKWATCLLGNLLFVDSGFATQEALWGLLQHAQKYPEAAVLENTAAACINALQGSHRNQCAQWLLEGRVVDWLLQSASMFPSATTQGLLCKLGCKLAAHIHSNHAENAFAAGVGQLVAFLQSCPQSDKVGRAIGYLTEADQK